MAHPAAARSLLRPGSAGLWAALPGRQGVACCALTGHGQTGVGQPRWHVRRPRWPCAAAAQWTLVQAAPLHPLSAGNCIWHACHGCCGLQHRTHGRPPQRCQTCRATWIYASLYTFIHGDNVARDSVLRAYVSSSVCDRHVGRSMLSEIPACTDSGISDLGSPLPPGPLSHASVRFIFTFCNDLLGRYTRRNHWHGYICPSRSYRQPSIHRPADRVTFTADHIPGLHSCLVEL